MSKESVVTVKVDSKLKKNVEEVFQTLGITTSQAVALFFKQVELTQGLPFEVRIPDNETSIGTEKEDLFDLDESFSNFDFR